MKNKLFIKHVRMTFDEWNKSIRKKTVYLSEDEKQRYSLIFIEQVKEKQIWNIFGKKIVVADNDFRWLVVAPKYENYVITMYMDASMKPILWYIDMIDGQGIDGDGVFFYNDVFLDLIVSDIGQIIEDDRDELEIALNQGIVTREQYNLVNDTAYCLKNKIEKDSKWLSEYCEEVMKLIQKEILEDKCVIYR